MITPEELFILAYTDNHVRMMRHSINKKNKFKLDFETTQEVWIEALTRTIERMKGLGTKREETKPPEFTTKEEAINYVRITANNIYINEISKKHHRLEKENKLYKDYLLTNNNTEEVETENRIDSEDLWDIIFTYLKRDNYTYYTFFEVHLFKNYFDGGKIGEEGKHISYRTLAKQVGKSYFYVGNIIRKIIADIRQNVVHNTNN